MGQKVNPIGFRVGIIKGWESNWFESKSYAEKLNEDKKYSLRSSIWKYYDGKWKMVFHQGTLTDKVFNK